MARRTARPLKLDTRDAFAGAYARALGRHARAAKAADGGARIGERAHRLGLATLDLARVHDRAVASLHLPTAATARLDAFFATAVGPMEGAHAGAPEALVALARLAARLGRRTGELATARGRLVTETARRRTLSAELGTCERHQGASRDHARRMEDRLRRLTHRLLSAQEDERRRISRDLHDAIGQELTAINVGLAGLKLGAATDSQDLTTAITLTQKLVERSMKTVHHYAWELRPTVLDDLGLVPAVRSYVKAFTARTGLRVRFEVDPALGHPDANCTLALFRIAQGALSNIERHARARHASVVLRARPGAVRLEVKDDGRAFDVQRLELESAKEERHLGLLVMRERMEMVGGTLSIVSGAGRGTTVRADAPLTAEGASP